MGSRKIKSKSFELLSTREFLNRESMLWSHVFAARGLSRTLNNFALSSNLWTPVVNVLVYSAILEEIFLLLIPEGWLAIFSLHR